jgi:hypothetical protein
MRRHPALPLVALLFAGALTFCFAGCDERDPKALTDAATDAFQSRDYKTGLAGFENALEHMDASNAQYMRAALGRCGALAHVDPAKARIEIADVHLVVSEFVNVRELGFATDIMAGVQSILPHTKALQDLGNSVADAALKAGDTKTSSRLSTLGYVGSGK